MIKIIILAACFVTDKKKLNFKNMNTPKTNPNPINAIIADQDLKEIPENWKPFKIFLSYMHEGASVATEFKVFAERSREAWKLAKVMTDHRIKPFATVKKWEA
jgi:hypothetical protein